MWVAWTATALAGSGPWTIGAGRGSLYVGMDAERFGHLGVRVDGDKEVLDVGEGVQKLGLKGITTLGLSSRVELEFSLPWQRVDAARDDAELCGALGLGACQTTQGIGLATANGKVLLLDEYFGAPFSASLVGEVRFGQLTADDRERITNLGEGTLDFGPRLVLGRSTGLGKSGVFSAWAEGGYRFRTRNTDEYPLADPKVDELAPRDELTAATQVLAGPDARVAFGLQSYFLYRPGLGFAQLDLTDPDRFAALRITNLKVGGVAVVRGNQHLTGVLSVLGTALARNNPTDAWTVGVGLQWDTDLPGGG